MSAVAERPIEQVAYGPSPAAAFFITSKLMDEVPSLKEAPVHERVRAMLVTAEDDLFRPLLVWSKPPDFQQTFELLSHKYYPIRLQALVLILQSVGSSRFKAEYFDRAPQFAASLATHASDWGLAPNQVSNAFEHYFSSAKKIIRVSQSINRADPAHILRLLGCITQIDYGFTAMGLVFEGSIQSERWCVGEVFRLTHRSLLEYEDAASSLIADLEAGKAEQHEMFAAAPKIDSPPTVKARVVPIHARKLGEAGRHLRTIATPATWAADDQDSDYE